MKDFVFSAFIGVASMFIIFMLLFAFNLFIATPKKMYDELARKPSQEIADRDEEIRRQKERIGSLEQTNKQLEQNNQLAELLRHQIEATKKGSLSNRANSLAAEILTAVEEASAELHRVMDEYRASLPPFTSSTKEEREAAWRDGDNKISAQYEKISRTFTQRHIPRIIAVAEEFRANGLTDPKLDKWLEHPHMAAFSITFRDLSVSLSILAIKMEEKEKAAH